VRGQLAQNVLLQAGRRRYCGRVIGQQGRRLVEVAEEIIGVRAKQLPFLGFLQDAQGVQRGQFFETLVIHGEPSGVCASVPCPGARVP
jgi:hypothetical protein